MEKTVTQLMTPQILQEAMQLFGAIPDSQRLISDVENFVYETAGGAAAFILRVTHDSHRKPQQLMGELEWMEYLSGHGMAVARPILSQRGNLVESIDAGETSFHVTAFHKIEGENIIDGGMCSPETYRQWGRVMGKMHRLAAGYTPARAAWRRCAWSENDGWVNIERYLAGQTKVLEKIRELLRRINGFPRDKDAYGLIHTDLTDVNFFMSDGKITMYDFDDSEYHWFAYDLAVVLFENLEWLPHDGMDAESFARFFWQHFYDGYAGEKKLDPVWLERLPLFMKLREMFLYGMYHKRWDLDNLSERRQQMLDTYRFNIENDIMPLNPF